MLESSSALNNSKKYCNNCNYQKNVYDTSCMEADQSDQPRYDQNHCNDIKKISHDDVFINLEIMFSENPYRFYVPIITITKVSPFDPETITQFRE